MRTYWSMIRSKPFLISVNGKTARFPRVWFTYHLVKNKILRVHPKETS